MLFARRFSLLLMTGLSAELYAADPVIEPIMVNIPTGQLTWVVAAADSTAPQTEAGPGELKVTLPAFRMGKHEVTVKEFGHFIAATGYAAPTRCIQMNSKEWFAETPASWKQNKHSGSDFEPVTCIGWSAAQAYVEWLAKTTGKSYRLPSEAEWEYAARAGTTTDYYWGDDPARSCTYANIADQEAEAAIKRDYDGLESKDHVGVVPCDDQQGYASIVGMYQPNAFGLHDMIGNISEFTQDCFNESHKGAASDGSARLTGKCEDRVVRGGSWHWGPFPAAQRVGWRINFVGSLEGFRVAEDLSPNHPCLDSDSVSCQQGALTKEFAIELAEAQAQVRKSRLKN